MSRTHASEPERRGNSVSQHSQCVPMRVCIACCHDAPCVAHCFRWARTQQHSSANQCLRSVSLLHGRALVACVGMSRQVSLLVQVRPLGQATWRRCGEGTPCGTHQGGGGEGAGLGEHVARSHQCRACAAHVAGASLLVVRHDVYLEHAAGSESRPRTLDHRRHQE